MARAILAVAALAAVSLAQDAVPHLPVYDDAAFDRAVEEAIAPSSTPLLVRFFLTG